MPLQERRGERSRTICSCDHMNTLRNSYRESQLEYSWLQEQTPATAKAVYFRLFVIFFSGALRVIVILMK